MCGGEHVHEHGQGHDIFDFIKVKGMGIKVMFLTVEATTTEK